MEVKGNMEAKEIAEFEGRPKSAGQAKQHLVDGTTEPAKSGAKAPRRPADDVAIESILANFNRLSPRGLSRLSAELVEKGSPESLELFTAKFGKLYDETYPTEG